MNDFDRGFVIGLLVGGGSFTADREQPALSIKLNARDPEPLRRLELLLGGKVFGPYNHGGRHYYVWHLRGSQLRAAIPLFRDYLPPCWKRAQFEQWLDKHKASFGDGDRPEGIAVAE